MNSRQGGVRLEKTRVQWLDLCKFFGILYMVWGHAGVSKELDIYLHAFHMPIFFFISGFLFHPQRYSFPQFLWSRVKSLLIPYAVFGFGLSMLWNLVYLWLDPAQMVPVSQVLYSMATFNADLSPFAVVQWFLTCLFFVEIAFYLLVRLARSHPIPILLVVVACSVVGHFYNQWIPFRLVLALDCALVGVVFFGMGYGFSKVSHTKAGQWVLSAPWWLLPLCFGAGLGLSLWNGYVNMRTMTYQNYFLFYAAAICSIFFYLLLSIRLSGLPRFSQCWFYKGLLYLGRNTLILLLLNQSAKRLLYLLLPIREWRVMMGYYPGLCMDIGIMVAMFLLCIPCAFFLNRWLPWIVGKRRKRPQLGSKT